MKTFRTSLVVLASLSLGSAFAGPKSTVPGLTIENSHELASEGGRIIRGAAPLDKEDELDDLGVTDVLIFKNQTGSEVNQEISALKKLGFKYANQIPAGQTGKRIHWKGFEFPWKNIIIPGNPSLSKKNAVKACQQVIGALNLLQDVEKNKKRNLFFHCTVGQDRTGLLAGIYRMAENGWTEDQAFQNEMCAHGFAEGYRAVPPAHPKPDHVSETVRDNLLPVFKMAISAVRYAKSQGIRVQPSHCKASTIANFDSDEYPKCKVFTQ